MKSLPYLKKGYNEKENWVQIVWHVPTNSRAQIPRSDISLYGVTGEGNGAIDALKSPNGTVR